jgi:ubiquinone biosynthesis protein UbiJ
VLFHGRFYFVMISPSFLIPAAVNHLLVAEPRAQARLAAHAGKVVRIDAGVATLAFRIASDGLLTEANDEEKANVTIRMKLADLPLMAQHRERAFSYVQIEGDAEFASVIAQVAQSLHWEAEEDLSRIVGDMAARRLVQGGKGAVHAAQSAQRKLAENVAEYFLEENPMLVSPIAVSDFADKVVKLRDDVERLGKRIEKLIEKGRQETK